MAKITLSFFMVLAMAFGMAITTNAQSDENTPVFSREAGFYAEPFYLTITAAQGAVIRYTTDGSEPTRTSPALDGSIRIYAPNPQTNSPLTQVAVGWAYEFGWGWTNEFTPRPVFNAMVVRARAFDSAGQPISDTVTQTFIIGREFNVPVISLSMEPWQFVGTDYGMYTNWGPRRYASDYPRHLPVWPSMDWEGARHVVNFEMFDASGERIVSQGARAWVSGQHSRRHAKRSFRFNFNQGDGDIRGLAELIPGTRRTYYNQEYLDTFRHMGARLSEQHRTGIRDSAVQLISEPLRPTIQNVLYGAIFVNGEFWGMYELRTHRHSHLLGELFGIDRGTIQMNGDWQEWTSAHHIAEYLNNHGFARFSRYVCVDDLIDYLIIGFHFGNWDWIGNNFEFWRTTEPVDGVFGGDGKWRFVVHDFDHSIGSHFDVDFNVLSDFVLQYPRAESWRRPYWVARFINQLFANEDFRNTFAARYSTYTGTVFHSDMAAYILGNMRDERLPTIGMDLYRWHLTGATSPTDTAGWEYEVDFLYTWLTRRTDYTVGHVRDHLNRSVRQLNLPAQLTTIQWGATAAGRGWLDINGAQIRPDLFTRHGTHGFEVHAFAAQYIRGLPVTVTANALRGYEFSHFVIGGMGDAYNIYTASYTFTPPTDAPGNHVITVTAVFTSPHDNNNNNNDEPAPAFANPFDDVSPNNWFYNSVLFVAEQGLFSGIQPNLFAPQTPMTHAMFITVLSRVEGVDTARGTGAWYSAAAEWAIAAGIISAEMFDAQQNITREDMALIIYNYLTLGDFSPERTEMRQFYDINDASANTREAIQSMREWGIIAGLGNNTFNPQGSATRAEVAAIFANLLSAIANLSS